jgi:hypothetical protein
MPQVLGPHKDYAPTWHFFPTWKPNHVAFKKTEEAQAFAILADRSTHFGALYMLALASG